MTQAQQNFVVEIPPKNTSSLPDFIWTGDRWMQSPDGIKGHEPQYVYPYIMHFWNFETSQSSKNHASNSILLTIEHTVGTGGSLTSTTMVLFRSKNMKVRSHSRSSNSTNSTLITAINWLLLASWEWKSHVWNSYLLSGAPLRNSPPTIDTVRKKPPMIMAMMAPFKANIKWMMCLKWVNILCVNSCFFSWLGVVLSFGPKWS